MPAKLMPGKFCGNGHILSIDSIYLSPQGRQLCQNCLNEGVERKRLRVKVTPELKKCPRCNVEKQARGNFVKSSVTVDGLYYCCNSCRLIHYRLKKYGLSQEEYQQLLLDQNFACAICESPDDLVVDHCHKTGRVRGLLCGHCNKAIGLLMDDPIRCKKASDYLG